MHTRMKMALAGMLLGLFAVSGPALAQGSPWYVGAGLGLTEFKDACEGIGGPGVSCDEKDTGLKLFGGYRVNPNFAVEFGYTDFGKSTLSAVGFGSASLEASGLEVLAVGIAPISPQWSLFGKVGLFAWDLDLKDGTGLIGSASESGTDLTFGFGASYDFSRNAAVRFEYQQYNDVGDPSTTGEGDGTFLGAALIYKF